MLENRQVAPWGKVLAVSVAALVLVAAAVAGWLSMPARSPRRLALGSGEPGGSYHALGAAVADVLGKGLASRGITVEAVPSLGSADNMARLQRGEVDLALVQNDTPGAASVRTIASLYDELLHIVVRDDADPPIETVFDLRDHVVAVGAEGSGTATLATRVLDHFDLHDGSFEDVHVPIEQAVRMLEEDEVDAICVVAGLRSAAVDRLVDGGGARLLSLGDPEAIGSSLDGLRLGIPFLSRSTIPARTYGRHPTAPIGTVSVRALLVCRESLADDDVAEMTRQLFRNKARLAEGDPVAARLRESHEAADVRFPYHDGAIAYYTRHRPSFLVTYAESISLILSVLLAGGSGAFALREWLRRKKKNRIDVYYLAIDRIAQSLEAGAATREQLLAKRRELDELRRDAFRELIAERLEADESFTIFQDFLQSEVAEIDRLLARLPPEPAA